MVGATEDPYRGGDRDEVRSRGVVVKFMVFIVRRPDLSTDAFRRHFRDVHGPLVCALPGLVRYVQNVAVPDEEASPGFAVCDAVAELWFRDRAALDAVWRTAAGRAASADNANFMDLTRSAWTVVEEELGRVAGPDRP
jgi:uncharacterized protein (TIGR02118 family)